MIKIPTNLKVNLFFIWSFKFQLPKIFAFYGTLDTNSQKNSNNTEAIANLILQVKVANGLRVLKSPIVCGLELWPRYVNCIFTRDWSWWTVVSRWTSIPSDAIDWCRCVCSRGTVVTGRAVASWLGKTWRAAELARVTRQAITWNLTLLFYLFVCKMYTKRQRENATIFEKG